MTTALLLIINTMNYYLIAKHVYIGFPQESSCVGKQNSIHVTIGQLSIVVNDLYYLFELLISIIIMDSILIINPLAKQ